MLNKAGTPRTEAAPAGTFTLTSQGYVIPNYVFLGWSERRVPILRSQVAESKVHSQLHRVGEPLSVSQNTTLYAVWAVDANNNGRPDYNQATELLPLNKEYIKKKLAELEQKRRAAESGAARFNLRSAPVSLPKWDIHGDLLAYEDRVYFVNCVYGIDSAQFAYDPLLFIRSNENFFQGYKHDLIRPNHDLELVFEYGGVLEDTCLIGGKDQKPLKRILYPSSGSPQNVDSLINTYPMKFTRIKEDGEAILKLYFVRKGTDTLANAHDTTDWEVDGHVGTFNGVKQPFAIPETGEPTDTLTLRFRIYNKPTFAATTIRSRVHYGDTMRLSYAHLSGTPTKYMMRSLDGGWNWHPADSPLTDVEKDLLQDDSVRVCLRQLDQAVGWAAYQKDGFLDPNNFSYERHYGQARYNDFATECRTKYYMQLYNALPANVQQYVRDTIVDFGLSLPWASMSDEERVGAFGDIGGGV